jgi:gluconokinase
MGVSGCGKSTVGTALASRLGAVFTDGDDLHPAANIAKMSRGEPLADADRWPWLTGVAQTLRGEGIRIVGCSALKRVYRNHIRQGAGGPVTSVHLSGARGGDRGADGGADRAFHAASLAGQPVCHAGSTRSG